MDGVTALFTREQFANELEASGSALCDCDGYEAPTNPKTNAMMAHHCDCPAVEASKVIRLGESRTLHAQECEHPQGDES